jgi:hypothetical protein
VPRERRRDWIWPSAAAVLAFVPLAGALSNTRIFYVRDLALYFWPRHRWLHQTWAAGEWPWWDPYAGAGQSAVADALNQFFLLPVVLLRLLAPEVLGFNLWVALPFPTAAIGAWLWLRRHASPGAAFVGASALAISGPMLSTGNFPNLSWSAAFIPWVIWAAERVGEGPPWRRVSVLALAVALQALAGEPVTLAATVALIAVYPLVGVVSHRWRARFADLGRVVSGIAAGILLAAVQLVPLAFAAARSPRTERAGDGFWSLHPLGLLEVLVPHVFGHAYNGSPSTFPWMQALNSNREPLFFSLYIGVGILALALVRATDDERRRWRLFWWSVGAVALVLAGGQYSPPYGWLQTVLPPLRSLRFPVKYTIFIPIALAALATAGADALLSHARGRTTLRRPTSLFVVLGSLVVASVTLAVVNLGATGIALSWAEALARSLGVEEPAEAAKWVVGPSTTLWTRLAVLGFSAAVLAYAAWERRRGAVLAAALLSTLAIADPLFANLDLNPTVPAATFSEPPWVQVTRAHAEDRVYIGGQLAFGTVSGSKPETIDGPDDVLFPASLEYTEAVATFGTQYIFSPAASGVRQLISYDLPELWPREYRQMLRRFVRHPFEDRVRFLGRAGVRYCALPKPPREGAAPLLTLEPFFVSLHLYECADQPQRVYITRDARIEPDLTRQIDLLFDQTHDPTSVVLLRQPPPAPAGEPGTPEPPAATIASERNTALVVRATTGASGGFLNVLDSYDPYWQVTVDGEPAPLLRANAIFRAVRLAPGIHEVRFAYRPMPLYAGLGVSILVALFLLGGCAIESRRTTDGFSRGVESEGSTCRVSVPVGQGLHEHEEKPARGEAQ